MEKLPIASSEPRHGTTYIVGPGSRRPVYPRSTAIDQSGEGAAVPPPKQCSHSRGMGMGVGYDLPPRASQPVLTGSRLFFLLSVAVVVAAAVLDQHPLTNVRSGADRKAKVLTCGAYAPVRVRARVCVCVWCIVQCCRKPVLATRALTSSSSSSKGSRHALEARCCVCVLRRGVGSPRHIPPHTHTHPGWVI